MEHLAWALPWALEIEFHEVGSADVHFLCVGSHVEDVLDGGMDNHNCSHPFTQTIQSRSSALSFPTND